MRVGAEAVPQEAAYSSRERAVARSWRAVVTCCRAAVVAVVVRLPIAPLTYQAVLAGLLAGTVVLHTVHGYGQITAQNLAALPQPEFFKHFMYHFELPAHITGRNTVQSLLLPCRV